MAPVILEAKGTVSQVIWPTADLFSTPVTRASVEADTQTHTGVEEEGCTVVQIPIIPPTLREVFSHVGIAANQIVLEVRNQVLCILTPPALLWFVRLRYIRLNGLLAAG